MVIYLVRCSGWDEHGVTEALHDSVPIHSVLFVQSSTEVPIQVPALVMDGVVMGFKYYSAFQRNLYKNKFIR